MNELSGEIYACFSVILTLLEYIMFMPWSSLCINATCPVGGLIIEEAKATSFLYSVPETVSFFNE